jgi:Acetyltransferase (isoleucine patch superfamily)
VIGLARLISAFLVAALPYWLKIFIYRRLGYHIGNNVRIGLSPIVRVPSCAIRDNTRIGHFNIFIDIKSLIIEDHVQIGFMNIIRGGSSVRIGRYSTVLRKNVLNSIPEPDAVNPTTPELVLGAGTVVTTGHWLDFTDRITIGDHTIIGGRNSSLWTHNRHRTRSITVGHHCYLGSEIRIAPGTEVSDCSIVSLGSVLLKSIQKPRCLIAGNPAEIVRPLRPRDLFLVTRKTRNDIPDEIANALLPPDLQSVATYGAGYRPSAASQAAEGVPRT